MDGVDFELTHFAIWVSDLDASMAFYRDYAGMNVLNERRERSGTRAAWMADDQQRLILALLAPQRLPLAKRLGIELARRIGPPSHIGVECSSREEIERRCELARGQGILRKAAAERGGSTGYVGIIADPDGNDLELSFGQNTRDHLTPAK
jgi:lactoylglutathione lyase